MKSKDKVLRRLVQIIALCLLVQIAITQPLWWAERSYPFLPLFAGLYPLSEFSRFLFFPLLASLMALLLDWQNKWTFTAFLLSALLLMLLDLSKAQVWFYFPWLLILILAFKKTDWEKWVLPTLQYLFPFIYFWAGLHKINGYYFEETFPWFMKTFAFSQVFESNTFLIVFSILFEIALAIGLWWKSQWKTMVLAGILFHGIILIFLGPFGQNWNLVVWPWNLAMMGILVLLYWAPAGEDHPTLPRLLKDCKLVLLPLLLLGFMPLLYTWNLWPSNLSFTMYAGNNREGILYGPQNDLPLFSASANRQFFCRRTASTEPKKCYLIIDDWAFAELKVAPFSTLQSLKQVARKYCACLEEVDDAGLQILEVEWWKKEKPLQDYPCKELLAE